MGGLNVIGGYYTNKYLLTHLDEQIETVKTGGLKTKIADKLNNFSNRLRELDKQGLEEMNKK